MTILIRPEQIELHPVDGREGSTGLIVACGYHGHDAVVQVRIGQGQDERVLTVRTLGDAGLSPGATVGLSVRGPVLVWPASSSNGRQQPRE